MSIKTFLTRLTLLLNFFFSSSQDSFVLFFSFDYNFIRYFSHTLILLFLLQNVDFNAPAMVTPLCAGLSHKNIMLINNIGLVHKLTVDSFCLLNTNIEINTWASGDMKFIFECSTQYLTSEHGEQVRYQH